MNIKVHRGLEQIGGCITEISTETSRIFIDFGQNLPGNGKSTTPEQNLKMVEEIFAQNKKPNEAVFYTHGHEDHVGLMDYIPESVPQYMSECTRDILQIKYSLLVEGAELTLREDSITKEERRNARTQYVIARTKLENLASAVTWKRTAPRKTPESITIGDIRITPFFNCHSIYDSHMFLIEADDKRIWHMGDYREHGYMGKGLLPTLRKYATNIDTLITEGTMLKHGDQCIHEHEVSTKMAHVMQAFKYVFVLASATDIERLASVKEAAKTARKPLYVWSKFLKQTMAYFTKHESALSKGLFSFAPRMFDYYQHIDRIKHTGMVMITGTSHKPRIKILLTELPQEETLLIYSSWDGYYKNPEQVAINPTYKEFRDMFPNVVDIHTSGHADRQTIEKVIQTINPKEVICIHKEADAEL